jgi:hypothetical protein
LAVGLSLSVYSQQTNPTGTVSDLSVSQSSVCLCDSVDIIFIYREVSPLPSPIDFNIWAKEGNNYHLVHSFDYNDIKQMSFSPVGNFYNDTLYFTKMFIPCDLLSKLNFGGDIAIISFTFKDGINETAMVKNCTVGIEEYELDNSTAVYYNFSGQIVEPKQGEFLIKQVGNKRIKVLIQ